VKRRTKRNSDTDNSSVTVAMTINTQTKPERSNDKKVVGLAFFVRRSEVISNHLLWNRKRTNKKQFYLFTEAELEIVRFCGI
jgi:hypothetical protein